MSADDPALVEEQFADWLAASAEALAAGKPVQFPEESALPPGMRPRMEQALSGLEILQQQLRRQRDATATESASTPHDALDVEALTGLPWQNLGRFRMLRELGRGGFGIVYLAYDPLLDREVALKVPKAGAIFTAELRERFYQEARAASSLQHPNLVPVYEAGEVGPVCFIVSAYCPGSTLAQWLKEATEPVPFRLAAPLIATLAKGLQHAHDHGVIHRDFKPSNVLLQIADGRLQIEKQDHSAPAQSAICNLQSAIPRIADFGLAKNVLTDNREFPTLSGMIVGTVNYMAPEQAQGKLAEIGPAADQYALGAVLYELLTGRPPFLGESALETLVQVKTLEPVPPSRLRPRVPRDLETICLKCLEKEPRKRYASAGALADDLERYLRGEAIQARRTPFLERLWRWSRRNPALAAANGLAAAAFLAVVGLSLAFAFQQHNNAMHIGQEREETNKQFALAELRLYDAYLAQARASRLSQRAGQRLKTLAILGEAARLLPSLGKESGDLLSLRNEAIAALAMMDLRQDRPLPNFIPEPFDKGAFGIAFDANVERYAWLNESGKLGIRNIADARAMSWLPGTGKLEAAPFMRFSLDERIVAAKYAQQQKPYVQVWDAQRNQALLPKELVGSQLYSSAFDLSPDGMTLAAPTKGAEKSPDDGSITFYDLRTGRPRQFLAPGKGLACIRFDPEGRKLAVSRYKHTHLEILNVATGQVVQKFEHPWWANSIAWSGDGRLLACACYEVPAAYIWNIGTGKQQAVLQGHQTELIHIAFSQSGDLVATSSWDETTRLWHSGSGRHLLTVEGRGLDFSRDDRWLGAESIAYYQGRWEVIPSLECRTLYQGGKSVHGADFSRDGCLLATAHDDGFSLWDLATGREIGFLPEAGGQSVLFHAKEDSLLTTSRTRLVRWPLPSTSGSRLPSTSGSRLPSTSGSRPDARTPESPLTTDQTARAWPLGPPSVLATSANRELGEVCMVPDGQAVFFVDGSKRPTGRVLTMDWQDKQAKPRTIGNHKNLCSLTVSPDGKWLATGAFNGADILVYEVATGQLVKTLPARSAQVAFSPDGKRLLVSANHGLISYDVDSWNDHPEEGGISGPLHCPLAFSRDGTLLAALGARRSVRLLDAETLKEVATLTAANPGMVRWLCFSPDGNRLAVATDNHEVQVWDLAAIRRYLATVGLNW